ncbi:MAG TPA: sulfate adenylyltransferase subunit CysN [Candidatus Acidoferrum sp.]|nr:sulfate adenylyltransferase subunit CysN [Candidatus Acidoferrum sp.]
MSTALATTETFDTFLQQELKKDLLRFTTAGSVDDGKSTLIGRLLHDAKGVYEDQLASVKKSKVNRSNGLIDFSLLTDGLRAEREQGITIDVAYRYFATARRRFIIADTPGHEQYTRNMATGASTANLAIILVDATKGILPQTRRHSYIASLLGIPNLVAAINKMDLVDYREDVFLKLRENFLDLAAQLGISSAMCIPVSATEGDNIVDASAKTPWFEGPTLLEYLETVPVRENATIDALRFPVQLVIRPDSAFRGFAGQIVEGQVCVGDPIVALPSGKVTTVRSIVTFGGNLASAGRGESVTLELADEIDVSRGDMLVAPSNLPTASTSFTAAIVWMSEKPLVVGQNYLAKHTTRSVKARVTSIRHRVNVNTLAHEAASDLDMNAIAVVDVEASQPLFFDLYDESRATGSFILIDPMSNATVAAAMIVEGRSNTTKPDRLPDFREAKFVRPVTSTEKFERHGHLPATFLLAGVTLESVERALFEASFETVVLRADSLHHDSFFKVFDLLYSAGFVILVDARGLEADVLNGVKQGSGERIVFDLSSDAEKFSNVELISKVLTHARSLRLGSSPEKGA